MGISRESSTRHLSYFSESVGKECSDGRGALSGGRNISGGSVGTLSHKDIEHVLKDDRCRGPDNVRHKERQGLDLGDHWLSRRGGLVSVGGGYFPAQK